MSTVFLEVLYYLEELVNLSPSTWSETVTSQTCVLLEVSTRTQIIVSEVDDGFLQAFEDCTVLVATLIHCSMQFI